MTRYPEGTIPTGCFQFTTKDLFAETNESSSGAGAAFPDVVTGETEIKLGIPAPLTLSAVTR